MNVFPISRTVEFSVQVEMMNDWNTKQREKTGVRTCVRYEESFLSLPSGFSGEQAQENIRGFKENC